MTNPSTPHPATLISQARLDAARPYIAMAMKGGGSVDDCIRAAIAAADQEGWQPIETAPRDGTEFDGWISTGRVENVSWDPDWGGDDGAWLRRIDGGGCVMWVEVDEPMTAWRPLPPAPGDAP